ncbi:glycoside hydrolase family 15 protein [Halorussus gelatinilyticus]|uniref:Glycoside hydrolase family 15 protein n=1 Tax=Halorussus gelatinilyticus TaxID=2937524 RepID=A0A8U0IJ09_9EURY|nr:glycoside hydrolase family 15 protein [Halorussus gelatinilyticus]UPW01013.1 glycoside hydrolase family 15 protein [Halorussus gelatinilyticus]
MKLRDALDDFKRHEGHDNRFPGERRTTSGRFSGYTPADGEGRLVHIDRDGDLRDFGSPLTGRHGLDAARIGVRTDDGLRWFDECETVAQSYRDGTTLVVTEHRLPDGETVIQYDLTLGRAHVTHVERGGSEDGDGDDRDGDDGNDANEGELVAFLGFAPDGRDTGVSQLHHADAVELYHDAEHDYVASATGFEAARGCVSADFDRLLDAAPVEYPLTDEGGRNEESSLSGDLRCELPFEDGAATLATLLTDATETDRAAALDRLDAVLDEYDDPDALARAAAERAPEIPDGLPERDAVAADLRALGLLSAPTGLRIAGPEFDPYYAHSGGYGYTWFRDDAEISRFLLHADRRFDLGLDDWHARSVENYCETQLPDGTWPHRVWPRNRRLAPGWANSHLAVGDDADYGEYQADQTASVAAFLADALADLDGALAESATETLADALDGLDRTLGDDGLPVACQNAWEDATGRFVHTAATFLEAYAAVAATDTDLADRAAERADRVYDALDDLWAADGGVYGYRLVTESETGLGEGDRRFEAGDLDTRCDSGSLALASAHLAYARVGEVGDRRVERLVSHVRTVTERLHRDPAESDVRGLVRYEGDDWRARSQDDEKIWTVSTAWGAFAAGNVAVLLDDRGDPRADGFAATARDLLGLVLPEGPLCPDGALLPEQVFDDGTPDSATPLGWPHALRTTTLALLDERDALSDDAVAVPEK